jgi:hypothetical protein
LSWELLCFGAFLFDDNIFKHYGKSRADVKRDNPPDADCKEFYMKKAFCIFAVFFGVLCAVSAPRVEAQTASDFKTTIANELPLLVIPEA